MSEYQYVVFRAVDGPLSDEQMAFADRQSSHNEVSRWEMSVSYNHGEFRGEVDGLLRFLREEPAGVRAELLAQIRDAVPAAAWPTTTRGRTLAELDEATTPLRRQETQRQQTAAAAAAKRAAARAEKERQARMKEMVADPEAWITKAERMVAARGTDNYEAAADILHDLREAIGVPEGTRLAKTCAHALTKTHPTLNMLKSSLRKRGLLP